MTWQHVWRFGLAPQFSRSALASLRAALLHDDCRLLQGRTMNPSPASGLGAAPVEAACAIGWSGWQGEGRDTVAEVEAYFERVCSRADEALGEPAACRHFLDWFDSTPRRVMRLCLLVEVNRSLAGQRAA